MLPYSNRNSRLGFPQWPVRHGINGTVEFVFSHTHTTEYVLSSCLVSTMANQRLSIGGQVRVHQSIRWSTLRAASLPRTAQTATNPRTPSIPCHPIPSHPIHQHTTKTRVDDMYVYTQPDHLPCRPPHMPATPCHAMQDGCRTDAVTPPPLCRPHGRPSCCGGLA